MRGLATILNRFKGQLRRSMTYDQGTERAQHRWLTEQTGVQVYFAYPHAPWERGICENINGLLRDYLPRGLDLSVFSQEQLDAIARGEEHAPQNMNRSQRCSVLVYAITFPLTTVSMTVAFTRFLTPIQVWNRDFETARNLFAHAHAYRLFIAASCLNGLAAIVLLTALISFSVPLAVD